MATVLGTPCAWLQSPVKHCLFNTSNKNGTPPVSVLSSFKSIFWRPEFIYLESQSTLESGYKIVQV